MRYLGIDYGHKRIGLACVDTEDPPVKALQAATQKSLDKRLDHIEEIVKRQSIQALVVGYPYNIDGSVGFKAKEVDDFIHALSKRLTLKVHRVDESFSSRLADESMSKPKKSLSKRIQERKKGTRDSLAACQILRDFLSEQHYG